MSALVDWNLAERVAVRLAGREPFAQSYHASSLEPDLAELVAQAEELVEATTGLRSLQGPARARLVDRAGWIRANIASFQRLLKPLLEKAETHLTHAPGGAAVVASKLAGVELGSMLGWMSGRVLGQYDLLVVDDGSAAEQDIVYFVGPNVLSLEKRFGFPPREFRLWLALHEVTHRAQFTGVPWLRPHFLGLVESTLGEIDPDPQHFFASLRGAASQLRRGPSALDEAGIFGLIATPNQRENLQRVGGLMSLLEGHGDVTMDRAGEGFVPSAERFARVLRERRKTASAPARLIQRITGLQAKLEQYEAGERFIAHIEEAAGRDAVDVCWRGPELLPTLAEIKAPDTWLQRVGLPTATA
ncbi:MAG TPA: zinc-dependent metalloprotease [Acidimicrobiales bacterium]